MKQTHILVPYFFCLILLMQSAFSQASTNEPRPKKSGVILFKLKSDVNPADLFSFIDELKKLKSQDQLALHFNPNLVQKLKSNIFLSNKINESQIRNLGSQIQILDLNLMNSNHENSKTKNNNEVTNEQGYSLNSEISSSDEEVISELLKMRGLVEFAEPDYYHTPDVMMVNDPILKSQWYVEKIGLTQAWEMSIGSQNVKVLVCDTGVMSHHPDLDGNIVGEGFNFVDSSSQTEPSGNPHGTLVSGLIGAKGNNAIGIAGLNWNIQIVPGKISNDPKGATLTSAMVSCVQWAIDKNIRLVNLSYNGGGSEALTEASKKLFENNGLLIFTSGNKGDELNYPKNPYAIRVGATDFYDFKAYWSNTGPCLDMVAPGVSMYSTDMNGEFKRVQGTSFAAPLVTGTGALLLSLKPELTSSELRSLIINSTKDLGKAGYDNNFGQGRLDVYKAIQTLNL